MQQKAGQHNKMQQNAPPKLKTQVRGPQRRPRCPQTLPKPNQTLPKPSRSPPITPPKTLSKLFQNYCKIQFLLESAFGPVLIPSCHPQACPRPPKLLPKPRKNKIENNVFFKYIFQRFVLLFDRQKHVFSD